VPGLAGYLTMSLAGVGLSRRKPPEIACIAAVFLTAAQLHCFSAFARVKLRLSRNTLSGGAALSRSPFKISSMRKGNPTGNRLQKTTVFLAFRLAAGAGFAASPASMADQEQHSPPAQPAYIQLQADGRDRHELHRERLFKVTDRSRQRGPAAIHTSIRSANEPRCELRLDCRFVKLQWPVSVAKEDRGQALVDRAGVSPDSERHL
jgi:hypothetical protein